MTRKPALNDCQRAKICARWLAGESTSKLAREFEVHRNTIANTIQAVGLSKNDRKPANESTLADQAKAVAAYKALDEGDLTSPLDAANWLFCAAVISVKRVATDPEYSGTEAERRKEIAALSMAAQRLIPAATIRAAKKALQADARAMKEGGGPQTRKGPRRAPKPKMKTRSSILRTKQQGEGTS